MFKRIRQATNYHFQAKKGQHKIITGVPRSGTTMLCRILCEVPNVIALNEPIERHFFPNADEARSAISSHFQKFRKSLYFDGKAIARTREGQIVDNAYSRKGGGARKRVVQRTDIQFQKALQPDFTLLMKHCAEFTLLLPELAEDYEVFAVIRNPLALLSSWRSVQVPVSKGRVSKADRLNPAFYTALQQLEGQDLISKQLYILSWYFEKYAKLPDGNLVYYENLVQHPVGAIRQILGEKTPDNLVMVKLDNRNASYQDLYIKALSKRLLASEGAYWNFYTREEVKLLSEQIVATNEQ
jgi:hypothetical protein